MCTEQTHIEKRNNDFIFCMQKKRQKTKSALEYTMSHIVYSTHAHRKKNMFIYNVDSIDA